MNALWIKNTSDIYNCSSYFITVRITFSCILYPQCTHDLYYIHIVSKSVMSVILTLEVKKIFAVVKLLVTNKAQK